jgi:hypothetical protein
MAKAILPAGFHRDDYIYQKLLVRVYPRHSTDG